MGDLGIRKRAHCRVRASQESSPACDELTFWGVVKWLRHGFLEPASEVRILPPQPIWLGLPAKADERLIDYKAH